MMVIEYINLLILIFLPLVAKLLVNRISFFSKLSPVFICYLVGIILANLSFYPVNENQITKAFELAVILAIPMLLFNTRLSDWPKLAGRSLFSFLLAVLSVLICAIVIPCYFSDLKDVNILSGMLTGIFVGGTPNMQAVGISLGADHKTFIQLNAAEVAVGGIYLLVLVSGFQRLLQFVLPKYQNVLTDADEGIVHELPYHPVKFTNAVANILMSMLVTGFVLAVCKLVFKDLNHPIFIMIGITTLSLVLSLVPKINSLPGGYVTGEYFLLIFCTGIGLLADFGDILGGSVDLLIFTTVILISILTLHIILCYFFKIDADNMIVSSTATIFGPAFIGQITGALKNKELLVPGMIMGLIGLAIANYCGVLVAKTVEYLLLHN